MRRNPNEPSQPEAKTLNLSVPEAARALGIGVTLCRQLIAAGDLGHVRISVRRGCRGRVLVPREAIDEYRGRLMEQDS